jgi:hypothetical protein
MKPMLFSSIGGSPMPGYPRAGGKPTDRTYNRSTRAMTPPERNRWVAVGSATGEEGFEAGREAVGAALRESDPQLLLVFSSEALDHNRVLAGIASLAGPVPLIGCSTAGEIATQGPGANGVVVTAFGGPGFAATTAASPYASSALRATGADAAACLRGLPADAGEHRLLILLTDGLAGDQQEIVRGAYSVAGAAVPMVGGCAGDDLRMRATHQFHGTTVLEDGVVAAALASDAPFGIGVRHGWRRVGEPMLVTESADNRVYSIDDQPALDLYLERLGAPSQAREDPEEFTRFASTHPLGLASRRGEEHVRFISGGDFERRSLISIAEVPSGGLAWFMEGDGDSVLAATDDACDAALASLGGRPPLGLVAFDCIGRRGVLGEDGIVSEIDRVSERSGGVPLSGFYTYGEIARTRGISGFHNQTLVVLAVS